MTPKLNGWNNNLSPSDGVGGRKPSHETLNSKPMTQLTKEEMEHDTVFKFGDIVENYWASENNPNRVGIVVRVDPKSLYLTDGKGRFWNLVRDKESKSKIIGHYSDSFLKAERERAGKLMEALEEINDPISAMRNRLQEGESLNGLHAVQLSESANYLKGIARTAITKYKNNNQ